MIEKIKWTLKIVSMVRAGIPQSQTAVTPMASLERDAQLSWDTRKTNKAEQPALFPIILHYKTRTNYKKNTQATGAAIYHNMKIHTIYFLNE